MKDKIGKLAKGITEIEAPEIEILPESFSDVFVPGGEQTLLVELLSLNGIGIKGLCFADEPRIRADVPGFAGRRVHITFHVDTEGMCAGEVLEGSLVLVTNGGEYYLPYHFEAEGASGDAEALPEQVPFSAMPKNPLVPGSESGFAPASFGPASLSADSFYFYRSYGSKVPEGGEEPEELQLLKSSIPEDEPLFTAVLSALIRSGDTSEYAFSMYKTAIERGINITRLYESYVHAFPEGSSEAMPREVLIYFSYGTEPDLSILRKLYKNIVLNLDRDSERYAEYESEISHYAMNCALGRRIDPTRAVLYDRMIYPGMIDPKAAAILPDVFKCRRIRINSGAADFLVVRYPEMKTGLTAGIRNGECYVPVYFQDAGVRFFLYPEDDGEISASDTLFPEPKEVTDSVSYTSEEMFRRPDILRRCFELAPEHRMLLLSAAKEISARGIGNDSEKAILVRAVTELDLTKEFRARLITVLGEYGGDLSWSGALGKEDYVTEAGQGLYGVLIREGLLAQAYEMLGYCGPEHQSPADTAALLSAIIAGGRVPKQDGEADPVFVRLCRYVFVRGCADANILDLLAQEYEGASAQMYEVLEAVQNAGTELYRLPEKILTIELFSGVSEHMDEVFKAYIEHSSYTETLVRAYLTVRCNEYFLDEEAEAGGDLYSALNSYALAVEDPLGLPLIYQLALTKMYSETENPGEKEIALCQKLSDHLISQGLVFTYTKKLRKKIRISDEIYRRFYVEYHASTDAPPRMLSRVVPDEEDYHVTDMQRVYKNIYVMSTVLFKGDELQYIIYDNAFASEASEEGRITVKKFHRQSDELFEELNLMTKAIEEKNIGELKELMLKAVESTETLNILFDLEKS